VSPALLRQHSPQKFWPNLVNVTSSAPLLSSICMTSTALNILASCTMMSGHFVYVGAHILLFWCWCDDNWYM